MKTNFDMDNFISRFKNNCKITDTKTFQPNEVITTFLQKRNQLCILLEGEAHLITYDKNGNKHFLHYYKKNDIFGEALFKINSDRELFVQAKKKCIVLFFPYDMAESCTESNCIYHIELLKNLPDLILNHISKQNERIELLTKKSVREKLVGFFENQILESGNKSFELPFSLVYLADYLMIERTAMMREIKRLKDEHIIKKSKNKITLLN